MGCGSSSGGVKNPAGNLQNVILEGDSHGRAGDFEGARKIYQDAISNGKAKTQYDKSFCHLMIANYSVQLQDISTTHEDINQAEISIDKFNVKLQQIFYNTCCAYFASVNNAEKCEQYANKVMALAPDDQMRCLVYINLSKVFLRTRPLDSARYAKEILNIAEAKPIQKGSALINLAGASLYLGNVDDIIKYSTEAIKPEYGLPPVYKGIAYVNLAAGLLQKELYEEALEAAENASALHPRSKEAYQNQAVALGRLIVVKGQSEYMDKAMTVRDKIMSDEDVFGPLAQKIQEVEENITDPDTKSQAVVQLFSRGFRDE